MQPRDRIELDRLIEVGDGVLEVLLDRVFDPAINVEQRQNALLFRAVIFFLDSVARVQASMPASPEAVLQVSLSSAAAEVQLPSTITAAIAMAGNTGDSRMFAPYPERLVVPAQHRGRRASRRRHNRPNSCNSRRNCSGMRAAPGAARDRSRGASLASK